VAWTALRVALLSSLALIAATHPGAAQDATWNFNGTGNYNDISNWTPSAVPTGTAFFGTSTQTNVSFAGDSTIGGWTFNTGASTYTFSIAPGQTLTFNGAGIAGTSGSTTIDNNGTLNFLNNSTAGAARLVNGASGSIDLSGLGSSGMTAGSIEGSGTINLGSKNLAVGGNNLSTTFSGVLQDGGMFGGTGGSLTKEGTGTLTLTGTNTYTGDTTVNAGTLLVSGSTASSVTINSGGTFGGSDSEVGRVSVNAGGIFAPGTPGSPGTTMTVDALLFQPGGIYRVNANSTTASRTDVFIATLAGSVQMVFAPGSYTRGTQYTILSGLLGRPYLFFAFDGVTSNLPGFTTTLSNAGYGDVVVTLTGATLGTGQGLNRNQQTVANRLNTFFNNGGTLPGDFSNVFGLTGASLVHGLSQLSGEAATGTQQATFQLGNQFLGMLLDHSANGRSGFGGAATAISFAPGRAASPAEMALSYAAPLKAPAYTGPRWSAWGGAYGGANRTNGDANVAGSHNLTATTGGFAAGLDYRVTPDTVLGFGLAGGATGWALAEGLGGGHGNAFQAGIYGKTWSGPAYFAGALSFSNHWMDISRNTIGERLTADFEAQSYGGRIEGGYRLASVGPGSVTPYAAIQVQSLHTPTYQESGGVNALSYAGKNATDTRSELGVRTDYVAYTSPDKNLTLNGRLAWAHDWVRDPSLTAAFQTLPGSSFLVTGAAPATDLALVSLGAELHLMNGVTLGGKFNSELSSRAQTYAGTATLRYVW
jgi:autotransporter-associated beta strand protein